MRSLTSAGVNVAINGGSLGDAARGALVNALSQTLTTQIGDIALANDVAAGDAIKVLAHAGVQCAQAQLLRSDCASAAMGAAAAEVLSPYLPAGRWGEAVASLGSMVVATAAGLDANAAMQAAQQVDQNNRQLHPQELSVAEQLARRSGGRYTAQQIADAMRASGNSAYGESVIDGMIVTGQPGTITDPGAVWNVGGNGMLVQQINSNVDPGLAAFIRANTGGTGSPYTDLAAASPATPTSTSRPSSGEHGRALVSANGQSFNVPVADCPAASCTNGSPIAWFSSNAQDQATLAAYREAVERETTRGAANVALATGALFAPPTLVGAIGAGAAVGGGNSIVRQMVDEGRVDAGQAAIDTATGAAAGAAGYGVVAGVARAVGAPLGEAAAARAAAEVRSAEDVAAARVNNNVYRDGSVADPALPMAATGPFTPVVGMTATAADQAVLATSDSPNVGG